MRGSSVSSTMTDRTPTMRPTRLTMVSKYYLSYLKPITSSRSGCIHSAARLRRTRAWHCFRARSMVDSRCCHATTESIITSCSQTACVFGNTRISCRNRPIRWSMYKSAIVVRRSKPQRDGSPCFTVSDRCADTASGRRFWTSMTRRR